MESKFYNGILQVREPSLLQECCCLPRSEATTTLRLAEQSGLLFITGLIGHYADPTEPTRVPKVHKKKQLRLSDGFHFASEERAAICMCA